jgi:hypothetical protein
LRNRNGEGLLYKEIVIMNIIIGNNWFDLFPCLCELGEEYKIKMESGLFIGMSVRESKDGVSREKRIEGRGRRRRRRIEEKNHPWW